MDTNTRFIVIGASAGGRAAITEILTTLPKDINAVIAIVVHGSYHAPSMFVKALSAKTELKVKEVENGMEIQIGHVYICKPNLHLYVSEHKLCLSRGPRENLFRPAVDVLFRSAAVSFGNKCVGILLTGRLNDGTSGLEAIKRCGGLTLIQNPATAEYGDMPASAQRHVDIDYVVNLDDMSDVIKGILDEDLPESVSIPKSLVKENNIANKYESQVEKDEKLGHQVSISCPSCAGPLWKMEDTKVKRYRCHIGHAFTQEALLKSQDDSLEEALWLALRTLEERRMLLEKMSADSTKDGLKHLSKSYSSKLSEVSKHIGKLRDVLQLHD